MTDARTEARRRIALAAHRLVCSGCTDDQCPEMDEADWDVADAVMDLFPEVELQPLMCSGSGAMASFVVPLARHETGSHRQLILRGPVEPVVPEEAQP